MVEVISPRTFRVKMAESAGIRIVPAKPDPQKFPVRIFACLLRNPPCDDCALNNKNDCIRPDRRR